MPNEVGSEKDTPEAKPETWLKLERQTDEVLASAQGDDRPDRQVEQTPDKDEAPGKRAVEADDELLGEPDFEKHDPRLEPRQEVIVGTGGSKRLVEVAEGSRLIDKYGPLPDLPSSEELLEPNDQGKSLPRRVYEKVTDPETMENLDDLGTHMTEAVVKVIDKGPKPTGTIVGTPDRPVADQTPADAMPVGNPLLVPVIVWAGSYRVVEWLGELKQAKGDHFNAGDGPPSGDPTGTVGS